MQALNRASELQKDSATAPADAVDQASFENRCARSAVRHVVLAVHGIGQRMGGRSIIDDAQDVRVRVNALMDLHMPDDVGLGYVQVLPVQWRKNLDLDVRPSFGDSEPCQTRFPYSCCLLSADIMIVLVQAQSSVHHNSLLSSHGHFPAVGSWQCHVLSGIVCTP
jgi:hypothetical protein